MKKQINHTKYLAFLIIAVSFFLFLSYLPDIYEATVASKLPENRVMIWGEHNYPYDYNIYLSKIRQGAEGRWSVVDKYDNQPSQSGAFLQLLYLLFGKIGGLVGLSPALAYQLMRLIFSYAWLLMIIFLNKFFLKKPKAYVAGTFISIFASSWPIFQWAHEGLQVGKYMGWWQELDVMRRLSYVPHYTLNYIILAILIILLSKMASNFQFSIFNFQISPASPSEAGRAIFKLISILLFVSFFIHPAGGLVFLMAWVIYWLLRRPPSVFRLIISTLILIIIALIPLLYFRHITSNYPWKSLVDFDKSNPLPFKLIEYILALGPVFFTGVAGAILVFLRKKDDLLPLVAWVLAAFLGIFLFSFLPLQSPVRFVQTANHIPLAILSVYFFSLLAKTGEKLISKRTIKKAGLLKLPTLSYLLVYFVILYIIGLGLIHSYFSLKGQIDFISVRAPAVLPLVPAPPQIMYPLKDFWNGLLWLEKNTKRSDVVLSNITAGNYIPAYSGNFVYLGHNPETPHFEERHQKIKQFFSFTLSNYEAKKFLKDNNIGYIFYGPQEKEESGGKTSPYDFLTPVYESNYVVIYKVKK